MGFSSGTGSDRILWIRRLGRLGLVAVAIFLVQQSIVLTNRGCRQWGAASIFFTTRDLLERPNPPWPDQARMRYSGQTGKRIGLLLERTEFQLGPYIYPPPQTTLDWQDQYGDCYVWVTFADRRPLFKDYKGLLDDPSRKALQEFPLLATASPPISRLHQILAWLQIVHSKFNHAERVEVYYIPPTPLLQKTAIGLAD